MTPIAEIDALAAAEKAATARGALALSVFETMALACFARELAATLAEVVALVRRAEVDGPIDEVDVRSVIERHGLWKESA